jgi:prevent-host-death family protein
MGTWQMQEAKAKLSELVKSAQSEGPQKITLHGHSVAVVISQSMYERLTNNQLTLTAFMQSSPFFGIEETIFEREQTLTRDFEL